MKDDYRSVAPLLLQMEKEVEPACRQAGMRSKSGVHIVPRRRGKWFNIKEFSIGGGQKLNRIVVAQECDARDDDKDYRSWIHKNKMRRLLRLRLASDDDTTRIT